MIVFLRLKGHCRCCKRYSRVDLRWLCKGCRRQEVIRDAVILFLLGMLSAVVGALLGLVTLFCW